MAQMLKEDLQFNAGKAADEVNRGGELLNIPLNSLAP